MVIKKKFVKSVQGMRKSVSPTKKLNGHALNGHGPVFLSVDDLDKIASGTMEDPRPKMDEPPANAVTIGVHSKGPKAARLNGARLSNMLTEIAHKNVGGRERYKNISAYRLAMATERQRLQEKYYIRGEIQEVGKALVQGVTEYRKAFADVARVVCSVFGSTLEELAKFYKTTPETIEKWFEEHPEFYEAVHDRSTELNMKIMKRLARKAQGYYIDIEKLFYDVKRGAVVRATTKEYIPPSDNAIFFWLKNRMPEHWKDIKDVNVDETKRVTLELYKNFDAMNLEQASDAYQDLLKVKATPAAPKVGGKVKDNVTDLSVVERDPKVRT